MEIVIPFKALSELAAKATEDGARTGYGSMSVEGAKALELELKVLGYRLLKPGDHCEEGKVYLASDSLGHWNRILGSSSIVLDGFSRAMAVAMPQTPEPSNRVPRKTPEEERAAECMFFFKRPPTDPSKLPPPPKVLGTSWTEESDW